ncbi:50S ribosomal protein L7/L12 [Streptomyces longwoodensis]|uniref:50S ribosomal protein L7/L12 n=1 Tax=Streptomyces longwoodensis TaxID=68231 RepID=UPI003F4D25A3
MAAASVKSEHQVAHAIEVGGLRVSTHDLLVAFEEMSLIELSEFVRAFEEKFDVTAAAAASVVVGAAVKSEDEDEFDVVLTGVGDKKIQVLKVVRELTSLGLKEAKDLVDSTPKPVLHKVSSETAEKAVESLKAAGAAVSVLNLGLL